MPSPIVRWSALLHGIRATPGVQVVILNHPRDVHSNFIPFGPKNFNPADGDFFPAAELGVTANSVRQARSRVLRRIREEVGELAIERR